MFKLWVFLSAASAMITVSGGAFAWCILSALFLIAATLTDHN